MMIPEKLSGAIDNFIASHQQYATHQISEDHPWLDILHRNGDRLCSLHLEKPVAQFFDGRPESSKVRHDLIEILNSLGYKSVGYGVNIPYVRVFHERGQNLDPLDFLF